MLIHGQTSAAKKSGVPNEWATIQNAATPFGVAHGGENTREFGYWFNYFWGEAATVPELTDADKTDLTAAFFKVLQPAASGVGKFQPVTTFDTLNWFERRKVLATLLRIGFDKVAPRGSAAAMKATDARDIFADNVQALKKNRKTTGVATTREIHLGFRADGRNYATLSAQGGFHARARSVTEQVHADYGLNQPWHPLSVKENANCLYLRKGAKNSDNCLHTVVSVAFKLSAVIDYPLLSDQSLFPFAHKDTATWKAGDIAASKNHKYRVVAMKEDRREAGEGEIDHLASELRLYVLAVNNAEAYSTFAWQGTRGVANPFPEAAVNDITLKHIIAEIVVVRRHFFGSNDLSLFDFDLKEINFLPDEGNLKTRFGDPFPVALKAKLESLIRAGKSELAGAKRLYEQKKAPPVVIAPQGRQQCPTCKKMYTAMMMTRHGC